jgi:hypothetical protein
LQTIQERREKKGNHTEIQEAGLETTRCSSARTYTAIAEKRKTIYFSKINAMTIFFHLHYLMTMFTMQRLIRKQFKPKLEIQIKLLYMAILLDLD